MENKKLWFRAKNYGWGWTPVTWQGWLIILIYVVSIFKVAFMATLISKSTDNNTSTFLWNYLPGIFLLSTIMIWICYKKGEKPEWRWGGKRIGKK